MHHDTITVIETIPAPDAQRVFRVHDDVLRKGIGFIETSEGRYNVEMNQHNSEKLITLMTRSYAIHAEITKFDKSHQLGIMYDPRSERNDDNTVYFTATE